MRVTSPKLAFLYFKTRLSKEVEEFWALALNSEKVALKSACLFRGTVDSCPFHPRDVFRFAFQHNASSLIVAHNHPTGRALPSREDVVVTQQLLAAALILELPVEDHLILAKGRYFSFLQSGQLTELSKGLVAPTDRSLD